MITIQVLPILRDNKNPEKNETSRAEAQALHAAPTPGLPIVGSPVCTKRRAEKSQSITGVSPKQKPNQTKKKQTTDKKTFF